MRSNLLKAVSNCAALLDRLNRQLGELNMYIRDNEGYKTEEGYFTMAEYCQVFLTSRYVRDKDESHIPLIERGKLHRMPKEVAEEMDTVFSMAVKELEKWGDKPEDFFKKLEDGEYDPISDFIDTSEMRDALGNVIMRRVRITEGMRGNEAFDRAKQLLPEVRDELHSFIRELLLHAMGKLHKAAMQRGVPMDKISELVKPKVSAIAEDGIAFSTVFDDEAVKELLKDSKKKEERAVTYDPAWG